MVFEKKVEELNVTDHQLQMVWLVDRFTLYGPFILA